MLMFSLPFTAGMTLPGLARAKQRAQRINCVNNLKQLGLAVRMYAADHNDLLPPAATWCDAIQGGIGSSKAFQCPAEPGQRCSYAFNAELDGKKENKISSQTVLLFESDLGWNGCGDASALKPHKYFSATTCPFAARHTAVGAVSNLDRVFS
jgi:hypothetical protein